MSGEHAKNEAGQRGNAAQRHGRFPFDLFPAASGRLPLAFKQPSDFGDKAANRLGNR
jgi:hypothetical protein